MRAKIIAANWKMNKDEYESKKLTFEILKHLNKNNNFSVNKILCVPFPFLSAIINMCSGIRGLFIGAQNCSSNTSGAYTGEVSSSMLKSLSVKYTIVGHSERREFFNESDAYFKAKAFSDTAAITISLLFLIQLDDNLSSSPFYLI